LAGKQIAPDGGIVENPAFDVTPNAYVTAIITERGIARKPYAESLRELSAVSVTAQPKTRQPKYKERPAGRSSRIESLLLLRLRLLPGVGRLQLLLILLLL